MATNLSHDYIIKKYREELGSKGIIHDHYSDEYLTEKLGREMEPKYGRAALERTSPEFTLNYV